MLFDCLLLRMPRRPSTASTTTWTIFHHSSLRCVVRAASSVDRPFHRSVSSNQPFLRLPFLVVFFGAGVTSVIISWRDVCRTARPKWRAFLEAELMQNRLKPKSAVSADPGSYDTLAPVAGGANAAQIGYTTTSFAVGLRGDDADAPPGEI